MEPMVISLGGRGWAIRVRQLVSGRRRTFGFIPRLLVSIAILSGLHYRDEAQGQTPSSEGATAAARSAQQSLLTRAPKGASQSGKQTPPSRAPGTRFARSADAPVPSSPASATEASLRKRNSGSRFSTKTANVLLLASMGRMATKRP